MIGFGFASFLHDTYLFLNRMKTGLMRLHGALPPLRLGNAALDWPLSTVFGSGGA
jgi:hypothetical protein